MGKYLDTTGLTHLIAKIKALVATKADNTVFTGATDSSAGTSGLVPAPSVNSGVKRVLFDDGTWRNGVELVSGVFDNQGSGYVYYDDDENGFYVDDEDTVLDNIGAQATLVSGTNIKTVNNTSLLGSGNVAVQPTLVSGTNIKTVNSTSLLGSGNVAVQPTLVSGTNIKTINNQSLLGSGNISISGGGSIDFGAEWDAEAMSRAEESGDFGAMWLEDDETVHVGGPLPLYWGGTGAGDAYSARANLGFGEVKTAASASVSAASAANVNMRSISLTKGVWLVCGRVQFPSNTTGRRAVKLSATSQDGSNCVSTITMSPVSGSTMQMSTTRFFKVTAASQTVYLIGYHTIGSAQTCYGEIEAVRIG